MNAKALVLSATTLCAFVLVAGCLASGPYAAVKPSDESAQVVWVHDVDLSILNVNSTLNNETGPGLINFELRVTNIDREDYTIQGDGIQLVTNDGKTFDGEILLPLNAQNNSSSFLTYKHTYPAEYVTGNVTFYVPQYAHPLMLRYVDTSVSVAILLTHISVTINPIGHIVLVESNRTYKNVFSYNATLKNNDVHYLPLNLTYFSLRTSDGAVYNVTNATYYDHMGVDLARTQPGDKVSGMIGFEIPQNATPASIIYADHYHKITTNLM
jgi:hypothetical protein